jgi:hypothetical protein
MKRHFGGIFILFVLALPFASQGRAQCSLQKQRFEVQAEASTIGGDFIGGHGPASGFKIQGTYNRNSSLGGVADAGHYQFSDNTFQSRITTVMAGPRFTDSEGGMNIFVQSLFGAANIRMRSPAGYVPTTQFASAFGGGVDVRVSRHVAFRLVEAEFLFTDGSKNSMHSGQISSGIVFRFGEPR